MKGVYISVLTHVPTNTREYFITDSLDMFAVALATTRICNKHFASCQWALAFLFVRNVASILYFEVPKYFSVH